LSDGFGAGGFVEAIGLFLVGTKERKKPVDSNFCVDFLNSVSIFFGDL
jgi:hypothetical protein